MSSGVMSKSLEAEERGFECLDGASDVFIVADNIRIPASKVSMKIQNGVYWKKENRGDMLIEPPTIKLGILFEKSDKANDLLKKTRERIDKNDEYMKWEIHGNDNVISIKIVRVPDFIPANEIVYVVALWAEGFETWADLLKRSGLLPQLGRS